MRRARFGLVIASVSLVVLGGCGSVEPAAAPTSPEAIVGGIETVAPIDAGELTGEDLVDIVEAAGDYACDSDGAQAWRCTSDLADAAAISIVSDPVTITAAAPVPDDTVEALADALGVDASAVYDEASGLRWP
jgi:hypothetical protein